MLSLFFSEAYVIAQDTDSLAKRAALLIQENNKYISIALRDEIINAKQADSLRKITASSIEKPFKLGIEILFQVRDSIDIGYERQLTIVNEPVLEEYHHIAQSMLPEKLGIPEYIVSPEERENERQELAMEQMAESIAMDFEREKLPKWQIWWRKHIRLFFGNPAWFRGEVTYINGKEVAVPQKTTK